MKLHLLVIDPQWDFCFPGFDPNDDTNLAKLPDDVKGMLCQAPGALFVPGADKDMERLAAFIKRMMGKIDDIHCTLDQHHTVDISHPIWWRGEDGKHPDPFTIITLADVESGKWTTTIPSFFKRSREYVKQLEVNGRYPLCDWPPHCRIGTRGATVVPEVMEVFTEWEESRIAMVNYVTKGSNIWTEHYSGVQADVPDPDDPGTMINTALISTLEEADVILLAGEAGSHCLANTVRDIPDNFGDDSYVSKFVLLEDATSPVPGFESLQDDFIKEMTGRGMQISSTVEWMK